MMIARRVLLASPALSLAGCGAPQPPPPPALVLSVRGGADQNPDEAGKPMPVAVRLVFLGAPARFERADVFALTERDRTTLGEDLLASEEVIVRPGEVIAVDREPKKGTQFLGVAVLFRAIDGASWRAIQPVAASGPTRLTLSISGTTATLVPA
ncbi:type VI secretion system lipoprotein TssJ [Roseomonas xinghualingensis]|uniref:type VI secretion system lipoprotein TssJ n=1 Tax=Roseomonas xinghualingensis TaxID=2986475 RepID=UPI0021F160D4|nr:type VI secretion system lipoprotein TssJ [Roseomonas sp. SXEYE001]MCV4209656.1 type VI secretion system lipoprotein TssJ [Roseomonas sp. SXEYE001]